VPDTHARDAGAVGPSVHNEVEDSTKQQPPPSRQPKRPVPYSKWGFPSAHPAPAPQFGTAQATTFGPGQMTHTNTTSNVSGPPEPSEKHTSDRATDSVFKFVTEGRPGKADRRPSPFATPSASSANSLHDRSNKLLLQGAPAQSPSPQSQAPGMSTPFRGKPQPALGTPSFANPFPKTASSSTQDHAKAKKRKSLPKKSGEKTYSVPATGASASRENTIDSQLTVKPH
jgi:hypothetical protein